MAEINGGIGVEVEHIFPVIKKWLYSEKEIFLREIVSNACDAVTKLKRLNSLGDENARDLDTDSFKVTITLDKDNKTITVSDNGIGMTKDEVEKYLCQIALSGALEFVEKYEGEESSGDGIIGHFGLGFYSAFMVSDCIDVSTKSFTGADSVLWTCKEDGSYTIDTENDGSLERGTSVTMHINDDGAEYLDSFKLKEIINKYCAFMPVDIYYEDGSEKEEDAKPINETTPLWLKSPSECTDEEYKDFYHKVFNDYKDPLFWIHIKADYPLNFKGILYFPKINSEFDSIEGQVKLYYNQVFVADNIKEVIPEFLLLLKGVIDCPELPLNVSRSYLQNSGYVSKISNHIVKKVSDKLNSMFNNDRETFEKNWSDIKTFVEYGCLKDRKFYEKVNQVLLFEKCNGGYCTIDEYLESAKEKHENKVYYASNKISQAGYISMFEDEEIEVVLLPHVIDTQFVQLIEMEKENVKFLRVDSELADSMKSEETTESLDEVADIFKSIIPETTEIKFESLKDNNLPAILNISEESRRMDDMMKMYAIGGSSPLPTKDILILNTSSNVISNLSSLDKEKASLIAKQVYNLCLLTQSRMTADDLKAYLNDSYKILSMI